MDAVAMGLISPGPVVIMATFAGYIAFGIVGAVVATTAVFLPVYLFVVVVPGKFFRRYEQHPRLQGFSLPPAEQLTRSLEGFLELVDENALAYRKLMESMTSAPEVREMIAEIRSTTAERILEGLFPNGASAKGRAAVKGWLWFMDGVLLDWIDHRDLERKEVRDLLLGTLFAALAAAGAMPEGVLASSASSG